MNAARACLTCEHFSIDLGEPNYSDLTPGREGSVDCAFRGRGSAWPKDDEITEPRAFRSIAERCLLYAVHRDLIPDAES